jgi:hypothetical protein
LAGLFASRNDKKNKQSPSQSGGLFSAHLAQQKEQSDIVTSKVTANSRANRNEERLSKQDQTLLAPKVTKTQSKLGVVQPLQNSFKMQPKVNPALKPSNPNVTAFKPVSHNPINALAQQVLGNPVGPTVELPSTGSKKLDNAAHFVGETAGQILQNPAGGTEQLLAKGIGNTAGKLLPKLAPHLLEEGAQLTKPVANTFMQKAAPIAAKAGVSALTGAIENTVAGAGIGQTSGQELGTNAAIGGAFGGAAPLLGKAARSIIGKYRPKSEAPSIPSETINERNPLALPLGREDAARARRAPAQGEGVVTPEYTFKLGAGNDQTHNVISAKNDLKTINEEIRSINQKYGAAVNDEFQYLKSTMDNRGGVTQGFLPMDAEGNAVGRVGRSSNNPKWYRDFYREKGRKPSRKELYILARQRVENGHTDEFGNVTPSWTDENQFHDTLAALNEVKGQLSKSIREVEHPYSITEAKLKSNELAFKRPKSTPTTAKPLTKAPTPQLKSEPIMQRAVQEQPAQIKVSAQQLNKNDSPQKRGFTETLLKSEKPPEEFKEKLKSAYKPLSNQKTLDLANKRINKDAEEATSFVLGSSRFSAEKAAVAQRLIDHYNTQGNYQRAVDVAQKVSEDATKAGQSIQALSMFNRLTPEGVLIHAQRLAKKTNEAIPLGAKEVEVTPEMAAEITGLAKSNQKMTGVEDLSNNVIDILDRAKAGEKLSETDAQELKRFVNESKQFIEETKKPAKAPRPPRVPQQPKDKRIRDNVVSFLNAQEQAAKERLRAKGHRVSSTPLDIWADYAIIGATKMGNNIIKFSDWSEAMVKDIGEHIRPNLHQLYEWSREAFEQTTKKVTAQTIDKAEKLTEKVIKSKELSATEADSLRSLAKKVSGLSGESKRVASQDLQIILQTLEKPSVLKRVSAVQSIGQLLNPKTQVRNALGNELFYRVERLNKLISTPIDIARSKITGGERTVTFRTNNQGEYWKNWMRGLKAGWKGANVNGLETQYDLSSPAFKGKYNPLTYLEKSLGAALKSFDTAAYMRAYNNTIGELATLRAVNEGQKGNKELISKYIREASDNMMDIADEYGKYVTFQDNNVVSKGLVALKKGLNLKQDFGIGDLVLKYPKTPGALLMRALEYSPAGFLRSASILARPFFKKEANTAEVTQALSRAIIGSVGLSGLGYFLLDKGVLTGAASKDKDIRDLQKSAGQGQYQINLSALYRLVKSGFDPASAKLKEGDSLYTYDWMQPVSIAISIGANVRKNIDEGKNKLSGLAGTAYNSLEGGLGTLTEQSVLSGLKRAAEGYPGQTVTDKIMDIISDVPASFVPTVFNQVNQLMDNNKRETYSPKKLEQSLNKASAKVPGLAQKLPQQYDTLGEPKQAYQKNSAFNVLFNPGYSSNYKLSPEAKFIVDLIDESGDQTLAPRAPSKSITVDGKSIKLDGDMYSRYQQLLGEETKSKISKIDPNASLATRTSKTEKALNAAGDKVRGQLKKELKGK